MAKRRRRFSPPRATSSLSWSSTTTRSRPTRSCWRRAAPSHREFQPGDLLRKAGPLAGSHRRVSPRRSKPIRSARKRSLGLGICLLHQEKPEPAIGCFDKVLARQPDHETALFGKAVSLQLLWKFDEATALYLKILRKESAVGRMPGESDHHRHGAQGSRGHSAIFGAAAGDASVLAGGSGRPGDLRVPFQRIRSRGALLRQAGRVHAGSFRALVQHGRGASRNADAWRKPPRPIRKRCASGPTPSRRT